MAARAATNSRNPSRTVRTRRFAAWVLIWIGVLAALLLVVSAWWSVEFAQGSWWIKVGRGEIWVLDDPGMLFNGQSPRGLSGPRLNDKAGITWYAPDFEIYGWSNRWDWVFAAHGERGFGWAGGARAWDVVLWPFPLPLWTVGGLLLWWARWSRIRAMRGLCLKCGYDLAGLDAGAPCPECGGGRSLPTV